MKTYQPPPVSEKSSEEKQSENQGTEAVSNLPGNSSYSLFDEAEKQANEARQMETKATTKFEWEEIGNKYKRAYALLASIAATSPEYAKAQEKINYSNKKRITFQKVSSALETPTIIPLQRDKQTSASRPFSKFNPIAVRIFKIRCRRNTLIKLIFIQYKRKQRREKSYHDRRLAIYQFRRKTLGK